MSGLDPVTSSFDNVEDYDGTYLKGMVVENDDPEGLERVKAIIPGIYDTLDDCVWIGPSKKSPFGQGRGFGCFGTPAIGSIVLVELQNEDPSYPIYHGFLLTKDAKSQFLKEKFHKDAWGFLDPDGNFLQVDMKAHTTTFVSQSKVTIHISATGDILVQAPKDATLVAGGNLIATVGGSVDASVGGTLSANVGGDASVRAGGVVAIDGSMVQLNGG